MSDVAVKTLLKLEAKAEVSKLRSENRRFKAVLKEIATGRNGRGLRPDCTTELAVINKMISEKALASLSVSIAEAEKVGVTLCNPVDKAESRGFVSGLIAARKILTDSF